MDWTTEIRDECKAIRRTVALFVALAAVVERAGLASPAIRAFVLWIMQPAEAIALRYLAELRPDARCLRSTPAARLYGDGPEDALRLARIFRAAARALKAEVNSLRRYCALCEAGSRDEAPAQFGVHGEDSSLPDRLFGLFPLSTAPRAFPMASSVLPCDTS